MNKTWEERFLEDINVAHYVKFYPDVLMSQISPRLHWNQYGIMENRLPNLSLFYNEYPTFSVNRYLRQNPDVREALSRGEGTSGLSHPNDLFWKAIAHYWSHGRYEGRYTFSSGTAAIPVPVPAQPVRTLFQSLGYSSFWCTKSLKHFAKRFSEFYGLVERTADISIKSFVKSDDSFHMWDLYQEEPILILGLYDEFDRKFLTDFIRNSTFSDEQENIDKPVIDVAQSRLGIIWGGSDINQLETDQELVDFLLNNSTKLFHYAISRNNQERLGSFGITSQYTPIQLHSAESFRAATENLKSIGDHNREFPAAIYIYNGMKSGQVYKYGYRTYRELITSLSETDRVVIFSNQINISHDEMPLVYANCALALRLTEWDGNANTVQECHTVGLPIFTKFDDAGKGLPWNSVRQLRRDIIDILDRSGAREPREIDFFGLQKITSDQWQRIRKNLQAYEDSIESYQKILFICSDFPGYGGAATNCSHIADYFRSRSEASRQVYEVYFLYPDRDFDLQKEVKRASKRQNKPFMTVTQYDKLSPTLNDLDFQPDLIILRNSVSVNLSKLFPGCPVHYMIPGLFLNNLDKEYWLLSESERKKYLNPSVPKMIKAASKSYCNSDHTRNWIMEHLDINSGVLKAPTAVLKAPTAVLKAPDVLHFNFLPYYRTSYNSAFPFELQPKSDHDIWFDYAIIMSDFRRRIKNVDVCIAAVLKAQDYREGATRVILIGNNSQDYAEKYGWDWAPLLPQKELQEYLRYIKCVVNRSHYESCSNVVIEGLKNGVQIL